MACLSLPSAITTVTSSSLFRRFRNQLDGQAGFPGETLERHAPYTSMGMPEVWKGLREPQPSAFLL